jgi:two-component system KDP operon response regulator KdpE
MTRVLIVDDDQHLLRTLRVNRTARGYQVHTAGDATIGLAQASRQPPDLAIVDLGLLDLDGMRVVEGLRGWTTAPIIVLSARHTEATKVAALAAGADDYVTKPLGMDELLARMRAALRRAASTADAPVISTAAFTIDLSAKRATGPAGEIRLTPTEWHPLEVLTSHPDKLVGQRQLLREVWARSTRRKPTTCACTWAGQPAPQARTRPRQTALPDHRTGRRIPIHPIAPRGRAAVSRHAPRGGVPGQVRHATGSRG